MGCIRAGQPTLVKPLFAWLLTAAVCVTPAAAYGFESLFGRIRVDSSLANVFPDSDAVADVQDGFLLGTGSERIRRLPDGRLSIQRTRHYTALRHPDTGAVATLPEPWDVTANLLLTPSLRLIRNDTRFNFRRSGDTVFPDHPLSERHAWLFESDHTLVFAYDQGRRLQQQGWKQGKLVKQENYAYPSQAVPLESVGLYLTVAVQRGVDRFDFDLLGPDGSLHGVRSQIVRTRDLRRFAEGYRVPKERLLAGHPLAVVDMRLASPIKYLFFPHHFYMAYSTEHPDQLIMMWGGDPDTNLQAFRRQ